MNSTSTNSYKWLRVWVLWFLSVLRYWIFFFWAVLLSFRLKKSCLHLDAPNWELPVIYTCFNKISKWDSSHARHSKSPLVFVYLIFYPFACCCLCHEVVFLQWFGGHFLGCLADGFPHWPLRLLQFQREINAYWQDLSVGRWCYYAVLRVSASSTAPPLEYSRPPPRYGGSPWPAAAEGEGKCCCWSLVLTLAAVNPFLRCPAAAVCWWVKNYSRQQDHLQTLIY